MKLHQLPNPDEGPITVSTDDTAGVAERHLFARFANRRTSVARSTVEQRTKRDRSPARKAVRTFGFRGLPGRGGGRWTLVDKPAEYRGTSNQVCGIWPWLVSAGTPTIGTYLGENLDTGQALCFDPLNWFHRANLVSNPSVFILGLPGLGKSTLCRKMVTGAIASGVTPMILGDLKGEYVDQIHKMAGQVVKVGPGEGTINPLAVGALGSILPILEAHGFEEEFKRVQAEVLSRQVEMTGALIAMVRKDRPVSDTEEAVLSRALELITSDVRFGPGTPPLLTDLREFLADGHPDLFATCESETHEQYLEVTRPLRMSLRALIDTPVGRVFSAQTSTPLDLDAPAVCVDVSALARGDSRLRAAVLLACWNDGFGAIEAAHTLSDLGLRPQRQFQAVLDELWQVLSAGPGMVERVDALTRINRTLGLSLMMITHTPKDLRTLKSEQERQRAMGFIERAGAVICGGLTPADIDALETVIAFTAKERARVSGWSSPPTMDVQRNLEKPPPGRGMFLLKIGRRPGAAFVTKLTSTEIASGIHNTNKRFDGLDRAAG
ncbi:UNVERIFIED_CONTAM: hypothetical protein DES50_12319 [Williamsia faeni]